MANEVIETQAVVVPQFFCTCCTPPTDLMVATEGAFALCSTTKTVYEKREGKFVATDYVHKRDPSRIVDPKTGRVVYQPGAPTSDELLSEMRPKEQPGGRKPKTSGGRVNLDDADYLGG